MNNTKCPICDREMDYTGLFKFSSSGEHIQYYTCPIRCVIEYPVLVGADI